MQTDEAVRHRLMLAGCTGSLHAVTLDGRHEVAHRPDQPAAPASVIKVLVAVAVEQRIADGALDPARRVRLGAAGRTPGPVGLSLFAEDADLAVRDLVTLMLTISDNVATDALLRLVGLDAVAATASGLGLSATRMEVDLRTLVTALTAYADPGTAPELSPDGPMTTTARDMTTLLRGIWSDTAAAPTACARVRWAMARQLTRDRLASAFGPDVAVAAKSGGLMGVVRNEIGMVTAADGRSYAVAVLTRVDRPPMDPHAVDRAIADVARTAVDELRRQM